MQINPYIDHDYAKTNADPGSIVKPVVEKLNDIQYYDSMVMGLDDLLRYADRNSMAHGREVRLPFLCHHLAQFVFSLPSHFRNQGRIYQVDPQEINERETAG